MQIRQLRQARDAAATEDVAGYRPALRRVGENRPLRFEAARSIGLRKCSRGA